MGARVTFALYVGEGLAPPVERIKPYDTRVSRIVRAGVHQFSAYQIPRRDVEAPSPTVLGTFIR